MEQRCLLYLTTGSIKQKEVCKLFSPKLRDEDPLHLSSPSGQCARLVTNEEMLGWPLWLPANSSWVPAEAHEHRAGILATIVSHHSHWAWLYFSARTPHQIVGPMTTTRAEPLPHLVPMLHVPSSFGQRPGELSG